MSESGQHPFRKFTGPPGRGSRRGGGAPKKDVRPPGAGGGRAAGSEPWRPPGKSGDQGWDPVAGWYDKLVGDGGSDYHRNVILPAVLRMLDPREGERCLDLCCGQGVLIPHLLERRVASVTGVDASPKLVDAARRRHGRRDGVELVVDDACQPGARWADGGFAAAACVMAVHDVPEIGGLFENLARALRPDGRAVLVFLHPCFRVPRQSHWGWDPDHKIQYRRVDRYAVPLEIPIATHPGRDTDELTTFHHRPLAAYFEALGRAGLGVVGCEELCSHRRSQQGPRSRAEHRAAEEIPLFLALLVRPLPRVADAGGGT